MMKNRPRHDRWMQLTLLLLSAALAGGCAQWPRIDPSGERIFIMQPVPANSTQNTIWNPVFTQGDVPPECDPLFTQPTLVQPALVQPAPVVGPTAQSGSLFGKEGQLHVMPARVVAPIGSEVVLVSGLRAADGQYLPHQSLEWILSQDSVGNFVDVGDGGCRVWDALLHHKSRKLSNNYAVGRTSREAVLIDRGTPATGDDVWAQKGQSWLSLTSATEGTSHVTVVAPEAESWDRRRQTAAVHWIDAQWTLPQVAIDAAGTQQTLTTTVSRASNGSPIAGWIVRYEIVSASSGVVFASTGGLSAEIPTDPAGRATATLRQQANGHGSAQVQIQIIRPAQQSGDLPRLVVGTEQTTVTWSAPSLAVQVSGPAAGSIDSLATYQVTVTNPGTRSATGVTIQGSASAGLEFLNSEPAGRPFGNQLEWSIPELAPGSTGLISVNCRVKARGTLRYCATATSSEGLRAEDCAQTQSTIPALSVKMSGPDRAEVGEQVEFEVEISNQGDAALNNVLLTDQFDAGLEHISGGPSPIRKTLDAPLAPGKTEYIKLVFNVTRAGQLCHMLSVAADGGYEEVRRSCLTATQTQPAARPAVRAEITGAQQRRQGENVSYSINVTNTGNIPLTNVQVHFTFSPSLSPTDATPGRDWHQGGLLWSNLIPRLEAGGSVPVEVVCRCVQEDTAATAQVAVSCDQAVSDTARTTTRILPAAAPPAVGPPAVTNPPVEPTEDPVAGELLLSVNDLSDPITVGQTTTYFIVIKNDRNVADKNVVLTFVVPDGMEFVSMRHDLHKRTSTYPDGRIEVGPIRELRPKETYPAFRIELKALRAGKFRFQAQATSQRSPQPVKDAEDTTVAE